MRRARDAGPWRRQQASGSPTQGSRYSWIQEERGVGVRIDMRDSPSKGPALGPAGNVVLIPFRVRERKRQRETEDTERRMKERQSDKDRETDRDKARGKRQRVV